MIRTLASKTSIRMVIRKYMFKARKFDFHLKSQGKSCYSNITCIWSSNLNWFFHWTSPVQASILKPVLTSWNPNWGSDTSFSRFYMLWREKLMERNKSNHKKHTWFFHGLAQNPSPKAKIIRKSYWGKRLIQKYTYQCLKL